MDFDSQFCEVKNVGEPKPLTDAAKKDLVANLTDPKVLMELIPPEHFDFHGFTVFQAVDVTDGEVLSAVKRDLIEKESITSETGFTSLQKKLKTLFRRPDLTLSLAALQGGQVLRLNSGCKIEKNCIFSDYSLSDFAGSIYERAVTQAAPLVIKDLTTYPNRSAVEDEIIRMGTRNMVIAPLYYQDELIGTVDLSSPNPGDLNAMRLWEVLPLFSIAI